MKSAPIAFLLTLLILLLPPIAQGYLGETGVEAGAAVPLKSHVTGLASKTSLAPYSIRETQIETGIITEFINQEGVVFAVSWKGMATPDLSQLLGSYFQEYKSSISQKRNRNSKTPVTVKTSEALIFKGGHMRDVRGLAVVPKLLPPGIKPEDLQ